MKKSGNIKYLKEMAYYSSIGLSMVFSIFIGLAAGIWADGNFDTRPWLTLIGLGLGIAAGYRNISLVIQRTRKY